MENDFGILINGKIMKAESGDTMEVINPANGKVAAVVPKCSPADVSRAVASAAQAAPGWADLATSERCKYLVKLAKAILSRHEEMARLETTHYGGPIWKSMNIDIPGGAGQLEFMAGVARAMTGHTLPVGTTFASMTVREPLGVIGMITPWNFPFATIIAKLAPALATGNTCVIKPPSVAPLTALRLGELTIEAGLPPGVVNIVTGPGESVGEALVTDPRVAMIGFTGDSATGKRIMSLAGQTVKKVAMELGGKNAFLMLADADIDAAVDVAVWSSFFNSGQNCGASSRFFIHESIYDEFAEKFVSAARLIPCGDPMNPDTRMGPMAYKRHRDSVMNYIELAKKEGAKLLLGGGPLNTPETRDGYYVEPTIFGEGNNRMKFMREEIFGPVVGLARISSFEEGIEAVNDSPYGLCASVWTRNVRDGMLGASKLKVGTAWVNQHLAFHAESVGTPWGGRKESGFGKENSIMVLDEYVTIKNIWIDLDKKPGTPWMDVQRMKFQ
ncbi:MAG: aldehyde dehydrogenase [Dehalococcoidales bacterium]|nr:aldehyde dehydrogenase [Dehalococcoidales bacterium]